MRQITVRKAAKILNMHERVLARLIIMGKMPDVGFALPNKKDIHILFLKKMLLNIK